MRQTERSVFSRRHVLGLLAASSLAGCLGGEGATDSTPTPTATATATERPLSDGGNGDASGDTSLTGSCGAVFGDTDQRYEPGSSQWVVSFAYPMAGEVFFAGSDGEEIAAAIGYDRGPDGGYAQELTVTQAGPLEEPISGSQLVDREGWEADGTVTYDGSDRTVAVHSTAESYAVAFGFEGPDGSYGLTVEAAPGVGDPCPDVYPGVCRRVLDSVEPGQ